jgi:hypothetical protein
MDSVPGQTFLNYAYSWGASIVILGTLFKLTYLPGANIMLFIGMGTEVFVFFISAFDRPFDKTADGREMPTHVTEEYLETGKFSHDDEPSATVAQPQVMVTGATGGVVGGTTIIGGGAANGTVVEGGTGTSGGAQVIIAGGGGVPVDAEAATKQAEQSQEVSDAQTNYVEQLNKLTETLQKVSEQSQRLTTDSEEMENLNRTLTGICKVYEMQLKGASKQIGTIDEINEQTFKMANQIKELNKIYARMIEAMTTNMNVAAPQQ